MRQPQECQQRPSVFLSLRYGVGDQLERALSTVLAREGYSVFVHQLTADPLRRAPSPLAYDGGGLKVVTSDSVTRKALPSPNMFRPELFCELVREIGCHNAAVIFWSSEYKRGFWSRLEQKTILAMAKPIVVVRVDDEPFDEVLSRSVRGTCLRVFQVDEMFSPSRVVADLQREISSLGTIGPLSSEYDTLTDTVFVRVQHPLLGAFEISSQPLPCSALKDSAPMSGILDSHPVVGSSWETTSEICRALSGRSPSYHYRLPFEVEWEFAVRAGAVSVEVPDGINPWGVSYGVDSLGEWCAEDVLWFETGGRILPIGDEVRMKAVRGRRVAGKPETRSPSYPGFAPSLIVSEDITFRVVREMKRST